MKTTPTLCARRLMPSISGALLFAALLIAAVGAQAQETAAPGMSAAQKVAAPDAALSKSAVRRMEAWRLPHGTSASTRVAPPVADGPGARQRPALDRSSLVDFMARSAKRVDMRLRSHQIGVENACREWTARLGSKAGTGRRASVTPNQASKSLTEDQQAKASAAAATGR